MNEKPKILLVEDDADWLDIYCSTLRGKDYTVDTARSILQAFDRLQQVTYDVVVTDLKMLGFGDDFGGFKVLEKTRELCPSTQVVVITAYGTRDIALRATQYGAFDYVVKPPDPERFRLSIHAAIQARQLLLLQRPDLQTRSRLSNAAIQDNIKVSSRPIVVRGAIIGNSQNMRVVFDQVNKAITTSSFILVWGEPGTGKQLIAKSIHNNGYHRTRPFSRIACGDLSTYYGVVSNNLTRLRNGTIFFDDLNCLGDQARKLYANLLTSASSLNIRLMASLNTRELDISDVAKKELIQDSEAITIFVPPLRNRKEDIPALVGHFINLLSEELEPTPTIEVSPDAMDLLLEYDYFEGNVRELREILQNAVALLGGEGVILRDHLSLIPMQTMHSLETKSHGFDGKIIHISQLNSSSLFLTGEQYKQLHNTLLHAFPNYIELTKMVKFGLEENLAAISGSTNLADSIFELIQWADTRGKLGDLLAAALSANSENPKLRLFITQLSSDPTGTLSPQNSKLRSMDQD